MLGKIYFGDGHIEDIIWLCIHNDHNIEFWSNNGMYEYEVAYDEELNRPDNRLLLFKRSYHRFYRIEDVVKSSIRGSDAYEIRKTPADILKIEIMEEYYK